MIDLNYVRDIIGNEYRRTVSLSDYDVEEIIKIAEKECLENNINTKLSEDDDENEDLFYAICFAIEKYCHLT